MLNPSLTPLFYAFPSLDLARLFHRYGADPRHLSFIHCFFSYPHDPQFLSFLIHDLHLNVDEVEPTTGMTTLAICYQNY